MKFTASLLHGPLPNNRNQSPRTAQNTIICRRERRRRRLWTTYTINRTNDKRQARRVVALYTPRMSSVKAAKWICVVSPSVRCSHVSHVEHIYIYIYIWVVDVARLRASRGRDLLYCRASRHWVISVYVRDDVCSCVCVRMTDMWLCVCMCTLVFICVRVV